MPFPNGNGIIFCNKISYKIIIAINRKKYKMNCNIYDNLTTLSGYKSKII